MGLPAFEYFRPTSLAEALQLLDERGADGAVVAGGTDLLPQMRDGKARPAALIDIGRIDALRELRPAPEQLEIGALVTHADMARSALVRELAPALAAACRSVGAPAVRNRGTIGGNLAHASPAADSAPALLVLNARLQLASRQGTRTVNLADFLLGPGRTSLRRGELIQSISIARPAPRSATVFLKLGRRNALAIAVASAAVYVAWAEAGDERVDVRIALGSVAPTPIRVPAAEKLLCERGAGAEQIREAARRCAAEARPISDVRASADYRRHVVAILVERALTDALARARREGDRP